MANFYTGGVDTFNALVYGEPHPNTVSFVEGMLAQPTAAIGSAGEAFMDRAREAYERFNGSEAMRVARAAARQVKSQWDRNIIRPLETIGEVQQSPYKMHRYMMAEPMVRQAYHRQQCDGYSHAYVDVAPGLVGHDHYDYRRVMDGIVQEDDQGGWYFDEYFDELDDGDRDLMFEEQFDILRSWNTLASAMMQGKDDPTSVWNAEL